MESNYIDYPEGLLLGNDVKFGIITSNEKNYKFFFIKVNDRWKRFGTVPEIAKHLNLVAKEDGLKRGCASSITGIKKKANIQADSCIPAIDEDVMVRKVKSDPCLEKGSDLDVLKEHIETFLESCTDDGKQQVKSMMSCIIQQ